MNSLIFIIGSVALTLNFFSFLVGIGEWLWFTVIMQEKSPGIYWKWQHAKYSLIFDNLDIDDPDPFTIMMDLVALLLFFVLGALLGSAGLLFPLVLLVGAIWGARIYVAKTKAKS